MVVLQQVRPPLASLRLWQLGSGMAYPCSPAPRVPSHVLTVYVAAAERWLLPFWL